MIGASLWDDVHSTLSVLIIVSACGYALAGVLSFVASISSRKIVLHPIVNKFLGHNRCIASCKLAMQKCGLAGNSVPAFVALGIAWALNLTVFIMNWRASGFYQPPFGSIYHVLVVLAACYVPALLFLLCFEKVSTVFVPYFSSAAMVSIIGGLFTMTKGSNWQMVPVLRSHWFVPHVFSYMLGYSVCAVAFILTTVVVFRHREGRKEQFTFYVVQAALSVFLLKHMHTDDPEAWLSLFSKLSYINFAIVVLTQMLRLSPVDEAHYQRDLVVCAKVSSFGFPFITFGLMSGMLWALNSWGAYWSWDIKEIWGLITWVCYLIYFHARKEGKLKAYSTMFMMVAFWTLVMTFFVVNILTKAGMSNHAYAQG